MRRWNLVATGLALMLLAGVLAKSGPEIDAIRWHRKNGDRAVIHGVSFPIYFWHAPNVEQDVLEIFDDPGPLRPTDDRWLSIHVSWIKDDPYGGLDRLAGLSAVVRAGENATSLERAGYQNVQRFSRHYLDQEFACVRELDPRFHRPAERGGSFSCYGDGPIYFISVHGSGTGLDQFEHMMSNPQRISTSSN